MTDHIHHRQNVVGPIATLVWLRRRWNQRRDDALPERLSPELLADIGLSENGELIDEAFQRPARV